MIFLVFQRNDAEFTQQAYDFYFESELPELEIPLYANHLRKHSHFQQAEKYDEYTRDRKGKDPNAAPQSPEQEQDILADYHLMSLIGPMLSDGDFYRALKAGQYFKTKTEHQNWLKLHEQFESKLRRSTVYEYGLKPNQPRVLTMFSSMFLHGGAGHLIGNMIFLFIIGFVVEAILGKRLFVSGYLLAGIIGSLLYIIFNVDSDIPTIGASGAIAGLMGMYTVLFGLRKIRFFYYIFVYFDYVKAPAITLLPLWLGWELIQLFFTSDTGVNYYAHIGGICGGAVFAFVAKKYFININFEYLDQDEKDQANKQKFENAMDFLANMRFDRALILLRELVKDFPHNREYLVQWYKAAKSKPESKDYHTSARNILMLKDKNIQTCELVYRVYHEYMQSALPKPEIDARICLNLIPMFAAARQFADAERVLSLIIKSSAKEKIAETILILANAFHKSNNSNKYLQYLKMLCSDFEHTQAAIQAQKRLQSLANGGAHKAG